MKTKFLIIGAGIGGLSAAGYLKRNGEDNFTIIDDKNQFDFMNKNGTLDIFTD